MQVLILSDIHGNLPALEQVLGQYENADLVISLGDVVNYGPWSNECVELMENLPNKVLLMGNHEEAYLSGNYPGTNEIAQAFFEVCYPGFKRTNLIRNYRADHHHKGFDFIHTLNDSYIFPDTELQLDRNVFIGHSHRQFLRVIGSHVLVNAGSVGQNRLNADVLNYVLWDPETGVIDLKAEHFSADPLIKEMKSRKYPDLCINYILSKRKS